MNSVQVFYFMEGGTDRRKKWGLYQEYKERRRKMKSRCNHNHTAESHTPGENTGTDRENRKC